MCPEFGASNTGDVPKIDNLRSRSVASEQVDEVFYTPDGGGGWRKDGRKLGGAWSSGLRDVEESGAFAPRGPAAATDHACGRAEAPGGSGAAVVQAARALGCRRR